MPKKITKFSFANFGLTDLDISQLCLQELITKAKSKNANDRDIEELKSYRRLLRVRNYGKDFRQRERLEANKLKTIKKLLESKAVDLRKEIEQLRTSMLMLETMNILDDMQAKYQNDDRITLNTLNTLN